MRRIAEVPIGRLAGCLLACFLSCWFPAHSKADVLPAGTAIPALFTKTINAKTTKVGDRVVMKTMQDVLYGPAQTIPKGSLVVGHVVQTSYTANDEPSSLTIAFEKIVSKKNSRHVCLTVRAMASLDQVYDAKVPVTSMDQSASLGTTLVGGDHISLGGKYVYAIDGDEVGIRNRFGVFSRLEPAAAYGGSPSAACGSVSTLQSVAIFSSRACGLYGFSGMQLTRSEDIPQKATITLQSDRGAAEIHSGSAALLQVIDCAKAL
jgi:hypothetical protein